MTSAFTARHPRLSRALAASFLGLLALLAAVWLAPRASGAAAAWLRTPPVHLRTLHAPGDGTLAVAGAVRRVSGTPLTLDAGMRFSMAAVVCDPPRGAAVSIRVRTSLDGSRWSPWYEAPLEVADESGRGVAFTDPVWTGASRYVQVVAASHGGKSPASLSRVRLVAIDPEESSGLAARLTGGARRVAAAVADLGAQQPALAAAAAPSIVTRAEWGADESLRSASPSYAPVKVAFVHHTASGNTYAPADVPALLRGIYAYHTRSLGWNDIGYNFLVDRYGTVYEGRYGGIDRGVVGAHVGGFNTGSTGVSVLGTFVDVAPPAEAVTALQRLLAWKLAVGGLDPSGTATLTCGLSDKYTKGETVTFPVIAGHRQANYTECPGGALYALLPSIRAGVKQRMGSTVVAKLTSASAVVSPNGDGVLDTVGFTVAISVASDWRLVIRDANGRQVAAWSGSGTAAKVTWDGRSGDARVADGVYTAELTAGADAKASATVSVDTVAPRLTSAAAAPLTFSPNGDGRDETTTVSFSPAEACSVRVGILDEAGNVLRWLHGWQARQPKVYSVTWDGRVKTDGALVPATDGSHRFRIERRDAAGNIARQGVRITVDRTLGFPSASPVTFSPNADGVRDATTLAFKLTRKASVTLRVAVGDTVVRTLSLGALGAGSRSVTWDGAAGSGDSVASCRPTFTVTAVSSIGESSVTGQLVVDLYRPRVFAPAAKVTRPGTATRLSFKVADPFSAKADVTCVISGPTGRRVAVLRARRVLTGTSLWVTWKPPARGAYTVTWRAKDLAGNAEASPAKTIVTVR